jgi:hypothetical protein
LVSQGDRGRFITWRVVWGVACLVAVIAVWQASDSCRETITRGDSCSGFSRWAYYNDGVIAVIIIIAILGFAILPLIGRRLSTRPCPRCGERVEIGDLECPYCGFDYRSIGAE